MPPSDQQELSFKVVPKEKVQASQPKEQDGSLFTEYRNRFKVYSEINESGTSASESGQLDTSDSFQADSVNKDEMMKQLYSLQQQLRKGEEERQQLARKLAEQQSQSHVSESSRNEASMNSEHSVSRPFMHGNGANQNELSQYSLSDQSGNTTSAADQSNHRKDFDSPDARVMPTGRMSPIGAKAESVKVLTNGKTGADSEYSFSLAGSKPQRITSTPGILSDAVVYFIWEPLFVRKIFVICLLQYFFWANNLLNQSWFSFPYLSRSLEYNVSNN